jgi:site-specific DNA-methyltransferase (adenine-specific)
MEQHLLLGDSKEVLKTLADNSVDLLATDPPYGISFMGKQWDKALPPKEVWTECYRVLKPGSFIAVMSSPRSDVLYRMIMDLEDAGFDMSFSPILWAYHTGFPKASDTSKMIDKRFGAEREVIGKKKEAFTNPKQNIYGGGEGFDDYNKVGEDGYRITEITAPSTELAKKYEGSKLGFQPKPAVEHIIIGMKPHGEKSYIDNVLNFEALPDNIKMTYPFLQVPKPAKKEKDLGLTGEEKMKAGAEFRPNHLEKAMDGETGNPYGRWDKVKNNHPTAKPVKLMSYIITLFTREGDWVIDPFLGSGTTGVASKLINRNFIGIEREEEYMAIAKERCEVERKELIKFFKENKDNQTNLEL